MSTRIIAVANQKGGVGKTVTSFNLAVGLAREGYSVAVADIDPQANATRYAGIELHDIMRNLYDLFVMKPADLSEPMVTASVVKRFDVDFIPGSIKLAKAEKDIDLNRDMRLKSILSFVPHYDIVIVDCPPSLGFHFINGLTAATDVIICIQPEPFGVEGLGQLRETIRDVRSELNPGLKVLGVLPTLVDTQTSLHNGIMEDLYAMFGRDMFGSYIRKNIAVAESTAKRLPIYDHDRKSAGAEDYTALVIEVIGRLRG